MKKSDIAHECMVGVMRKAYDLINRQQEEIERLKEKAKENPFWYIHVEDIDNLVKEMVGAENGKFEL